MTINKTDKSDVFIGRNCFYVHFLMCSLDFQFCSWRRKQLILTKDTTSTKVSSLAGDQVKAMVLEILSQTALLKSQTSD